MKTHLGRGVVAVATALVCLLASASPASADTITLGTLSMIGPGSSPYASTILPRGTCTAGTFEVDITASTASVTAMDLTRRGTMSGGISFVAVITRTGGSAGTNSSGALSGIGLSLNSTIYTVATGTTCTIDTRVCEFTMALTLSGSYTDGFIDIVTLSGGPASLTIVPPCDPPFSDLSGGTSSMSLYATVS